MARSSRSEARLAALPLGWLVATSRNTSRIRLALDVLEADPALLEVARPFLRASRTRRGLAELRLIDVLPLLGTDSWEKAAAPLDLRGLETWARLRALAEKAAEGD